MLTGFLKWLRDEKALSPAAEHFRGWMAKHKKAYADFTDQVDPDADMFQAFMKKKRASTAVQACFHTAWDNYLERHVDKSMSGVVESVILEVDRQYKTPQLKEEDLQSNVIGVRKFQTAPGKVEFSMGITRNMGAQNYAKCTIGVTIPCYAEEVNDVYGVANAFVSSRMRNEFRRLQAKPGEKPELEPEIELPVTPLEDIGDDESLIPE